MSTPAQRRMALSRAKSVIVVPSRRDSDVTREAIQKSNTKTPPTPSIVEDAQLYKAITKQESSLWNSMNTFAVYVSVVVGFLFFFRQKLDFAETLGLSDLVIFGITVWYNIRRRKSIKPRVRQRFNLAIDTTHRASSSSTSTLPRTPDTPSSPNSTPKGSPRGFASRLLQAAAEAIVMVNQRGVIDDVKRKEVLGQKFEIFMEKGSARKYQEDINTFIVTGESHMMGLDTEVTCLKDGKPFSCLVRLSHGRTAGKHMFGLFFRLVPQLLTPEAAGNLRSRPRTVTMGIPPPEAEMNKGPIAQKVNNVAVLFCDIVGFTSMASAMDDSDVHSVLHKLFSMYDQVSEAHPGIEKIKTIGDAYMAASGLNFQEGDPDPTEDLIDFALEILSGLEYFNEAESLNIKIRIGINTGTVIAGVIGHKNAVYDIWGDTVNVASRMESTGTPGLINISEASFDVVTRKYEYSERREVQVKGKGLMISYLVTRKRRQRKKTPSQPDSPLISPIHTAPSSPSKIHTLPEVFAARLPPTPPQPTSRVEPLPHVTNVAPAATLTRQKFPERGRMRHGFTLPDNLRIGDPLISSNVSLSSMGSSGSQSPKPQDFMRIPTSRFAYDSSNPAIVAAVMEELALTTASSTGDLTELGDTGKPLLEAPELQ